MFQRFTKRPGNKHSSRRPNRKKHRTFEPLERREMMAGFTGGLSNGVLTINGTAAADNIALTQTADVVRLEGYTNTWNANAIKQIRINGGGGDDTIRVAVSQQLAATLVADGGAGRDVLYATAQPTSWAGFEAGQLIAPPAGTAPAPAKGAQVIWTGNTGPATVGSAVTRTSQSSAGNTSEVRSVAGSAQANAQQLSYWVVKQNVRSQSGWSMAFGVGYPSSAQARQAINAETARNRANGTNYYAYGISVGNSGPNGAVDVVYTPAAQAGWKQWLENVKKTVNNAQNTVVNFFNTQILPIINLIRNGQGSRLGTYKPSAACYYLADWLEKETNNYIRQRDEQLRSAGSEWQPFKQASDQVFAIPLSTAKTFRNIGNALRQIGF